MSRFLFLLFLYSGFAHAQEVIEELDTVQVSAQKKISEFDFSRPSTISTPQLEAEPSGLIAPQLNQIPGVIANQNGGPGGRISFFIRGTESRHVAFTLDGLKLNDPSNVDRQFDSAFFSSPFLRQLDVHKSPQSVLYGSDALGGLVELTTRKGEDAPQTRVDINGGSFGTIDTSIAQDWQTKDGKNRGSLTGYRFHSDGISRLNKKRFDATERDSSDITQLSSSSKHQWYGRLDTDLLFSFLRGQNELDGNSKDRAYDESSNDQYIVQQRTNLNLSKTSAISLRNGLNRHNRIIDDISFSGEKQETAFAGNVIQNELLFRQNIQNLSFLSGLSTEHEDLNDENIDRSFDLHSLFAQTAYKISNFKIHAGGRMENHTAYGNFSTGSAGIGYYLSENLFSLQYSQGFKAPSLFQLYHPQFGNSELNPEKNHSWEASWTHTKKDLDLGIALFQNQLSNLITFVNSGYMNQRRFVSQGVELSGKYKQPLYQLNTSFTHQDFQEEETTVLRRPYNTLIAGLAVFPTESSEASVRGRWYSSRKDVTETNSEITLSSYEVFDLGFKYYFTDVDLGLQLLNILDRDYEELYGYSVMPRSIFVHSGFRF